MDARARLIEVHQRSVSLYLQRQRIEEARQRLAIEAQACDRELLLLDGEIRALTALTGEPYGE